MSHSKPLKRSVVAAYRQVPQVRVLDELPGPFLGGISLHLVSDVQRCPTVDHFISFHAVLSFVVCMMPLWIRAGRKGFKGCVTVLSSMIL